MIFPDMGPSWCCGDDDRFTFILLVFFSALAFRDVFFVETPAAFDVDFLFGLGRGIGGDGFGDTFFNLVVLGSGVVGKRLERSGCFTGVDWFDGFIGDDGLVLGQTHTLVDGFEEFTDYLTVTRNLDLDTGVVFMTINHGKGFAGLAIDVLGDIFGIDVTIGAELATTNVGLVWIGTGVAMIGMTGELLHDKDLIVSGETRGMCLLGEVHLTDCSGRHGDSTTGRCDVFELG